MPYELLEPESQGYEVLEPEPTFAESVDTTPRRFATSATQTEPQRREAGPGALAALGRQIVSEPNPTLSEPLRAILPSELGPEQSLIGITPEEVPSGANISETLGIPKVIATPASAIAKTAAGLGQFMTSPAGGAQLVAAATPGIGLAQKAKWVYDMAGGTGEAVGDLSVRLEKLAKSPESVTDNDWQLMAEDTANAIALLYGAGKLTAHQVQQATGIRAPVGRFLESDRTRFAKDLAAKLSKEKPALPGTEAGARRALALPPRPAPPELLPELERTRELVDRAIQEATQRIIVPGQTPALDLLRAQGRVVIPEFIATAERIQGGGQAPYGKVSYMRGAEAPTTERTQNALVKEAEQTIPGVRARDEIREVPAAEGGPQVGERRGEAGAMGRGTATPPNAPPEITSTEPRPVAAAEGPVEPKVGIREKAQGQEVPLKPSAPVTEAKAAPAKPQMPTTFGQQYFDKGVRDAKAGRTMELKFPKRMGAGPSSIKAQAYERYRQGYDWQKSQSKPTPPTEPTATGKGALDTAIKNIEDLQKRIRGTGENLGMNVPKALLDTALEVARLTLKAGKTVAEAIEAAIAHIRKNASAEVKQGFDEATVRDSLTAALGTPKAETQPSATPSVASVVPPATPRRVAPNASETLADVYKIFEPLKKKRPAIGQIASQVSESVRTGLASRFRPIDKLAEDIAAEYGVKTPKGIAGIFEQIKGASGKGEADIYRFDQEVSKPLRGQEKDFNAYMFLRRSLDRLLQDQADIQTALAGGNVRTLNRRAVSDYTIPQLESKLAKLESDLGPQKVALFDRAAEGYQRHMDAALKLQVESGRMSPEVYAAIKEGNQFYAPFKVMKYLQDTALPEGSGRRVDTLADFTKAMEGIRDKDLRLGDMLGAARQNILLSRILAEKNRAMLNISKLSTFDTNGKFIRKLKPMENVPLDMETVNVFEGGKPVKYVVNKDVAAALQIYGQNAQNIILRIMGAMAVPFRAGATALNVPFQISNLLADQPRAALVSKYGVRGAMDMIRYPLDFSHALFSSIKGDMLGSKNQLFLDFLDSGVAGSTIQETLTPKSLNVKPYSLPRTVGRNVLWAIPDFAKAIEQTSKIMGVKRAMRFEGVTSGKELAAKMPQAVTELRRFSGSPDFGRQGKWTEQARLNILYMFFNARLQGTTADVGRLIGRDGANMAAKTWLKLGTAVGIPTVYLYLLNQDEEYADDYAKRPTQEKQNYWLIPKDSFVTNADGEKIRDYWRIPKRESSKWIANMAESSLDFARKRDPESFGNFAQAMMEDISPVNVQGKTFQERLESTATSLNPLVKAPIELASGRDMYRHKNIVPEAMKKASPEQQYTDRTAEVFKNLANAMPDVAPEAFRSPLMLENLTKNLTAGLFTQFLPRKPVEGRSKFENAPLLQRFQSLPIVDRKAFDDEIASLEREAADAQLARHRNAMKIMDANKGKNIETIAEAAIKQFGNDPKLLMHLVDLYTANERGITGEERQLLGLPAAQRADYIAKRINGETPEKRQALIQDFAAKRILTEAVAVELEPLLTP